MDVLEGEAMLAAARRLRRVVQVGTQRKSTPHLVEAKKQIVEAGLLGKIAQVEICCYYHMRANGNPPVTPVPAHLDYEMWTGPAPLRPYDGLPHKRWWRTFKEYGNITTASCILANLAMELGRPLVYDPRQRQVTGDAEATRLLSRAYRNPWMRPQG